MEDMVTKWDEFASALLDLLPELMRKPIVYAVILLSVLVITALCSIPSKKDRVDHSILGLITYSFKILLGFIGSVLTAIESITNFIDVVRVILRGKLTEGTQFLLNNYAIVALSVASFYTTFNGLLQVSNWYISILITFGVQVGILALSSKIALTRNRGKEGKYLRTITYEWVNDKRNQKLYLGDEQTRKSVEEKVRDDKGALEQWKADKESEIIKANLKTQQNKKDKGIKKDKGLRYYPFLVLCIMVSSYFSYVHFYEKLVHPGAPMDNYMTAMNKVSDIVSGYSGDLVEVQGILQKYLQKYNAQIRKEYSGEIEEVQRMIQYQDKLLEDIQKAEEEVMGIDLEIQALERIRSAKENGEGLGTGTQDEDGRTVEEIEAEIDTLITYRLQPAEERLENIQDEYESRQNQINNNSGYLNVQQVEEALNELEVFYMNPLYLENEGISEERLREDLSNLMSYEMAHTVIDDEEAEKESNEEYNNLNIVFNNYLGLSRYYVRNGTVGMDLKVLQDARDNQEYVISEYTQAVRREKESKNKGEETKEAESKDEKAADFLNNETAKILMQMIVELNRIPVMEVWSDIQEEERKSLNQLEAREYNRELYNMYRISSGNISMLEEAIRVWGSKGIVVSAFLCPLAFFADFMTFILTIAKGVDNYGNKLPLLRKIIYTIFFKEGLSETEKHIAKVRHWVGGMSLAVGLLLFIIYYVISETHSNAVRAAALVAIVMGSTLAGCLLIYVYERICESRLYWKNEEAYKELMDLLSIDREKRGDALYRKLDEYITKDEKLTLDVVALKRLRDLLETSDLDEDENVLTQRAKSLFKGIEIRLLLRITMESHHADREKSAKQFLKEGWQEYVYMAVLTEKQVKENHYNKEFAVLKARELVYCVEDVDREKYYVLSDLFMKILYDLIMEEHSGSVLDAELSFAEHISDYYEEQEIL